MTTDTPAPATSRTPGARWRSVVATVLVIVAFVLTRRSALHPLERPCRLVPRLERPDSGLVRALRPFLHPQVPQAEDP